MSGRPAVDDPGKWVLFWVATVLFIYVVTGLAIYVLYL